MAIFFSWCYKVSFFKVLTLLITPCVEVQERKAGATRKVIVQKEQVELIQLISVYVYINPQSETLVLHFSHCLHNWCFIAFEARLSVFLGYCVACLPTWNLSWKIKVEPHLSLVQDTFSVRY